MSQFTTPDGRHGFRLYDEFNRRISKVVGSKAASQQLEALKLFQIAQAKAALKRYQNESPLTISDGLDLWFTGKDLRATTRKTQPAMLEAFRRAIGDTRLHQVTPQLLASYFQTRREQIAPSTLALEKRLVRALFRHLQETGAAPNNPPSSIKGTYHLSTTARAITRDEELALVTTATPRTLPRLLLALDAGLRISEILTLRRNHIDFPNRTLKVWASKPVYRMRALPMTGRLATVIEETARDLEPDAALIPLTRPTNFVTGFRLALGFHFRFHDLRHTFSTRLMEAGAPTNVIAAALGHAPRRTTDLYTHVTLDHLWVWFARMEALSMQHAEGKLTREDLFPVENSTDESHPT
jgi:integrase